MKKVITAFLWLILPAFCFASPAGITSVFDLGTSVRAQALGGAFTAVPDDAACVYYNPAGMNTLNNIQFQASYMPLFYDTTYDYISAVMPTLDFGVFGASVSMMNTGNLVFRDGNGVITGQSSQEMAEMIAGWGTGIINDNLSAGVSLKLDYNDLANYSDNLSFGMDAGLYYRAISETSQALDAGLTVKNLVEPDLKLSGASDSIPRQLIAGIYYMRPITDSINAGLMTDITAPIGNPFDIRAGLELAFFNTVKLRGGYSSYGITSFGAGVRLFNAVTVDYGLFFTDMGSQNRFSFTADFGGDIKEARKNKSDIEEARVEKKAKDLAAKELSELRGDIDKMTGKVKERERFKAVHYTQGLEAYFDGDLKGALLEFNTVFDLDSGYMSVAYYKGFVAGLLARTKQSNYSDEIVALYRDGVNKYLAQDYRGAKESWEKILKIDPYNKLAIENLKEVNPLIREVDEMKETK
jgi:tetratricopeptide (TPR) repeat protein